MYIYILILKQESQKGKGWLLVPEKRFELIRRPKGPIKKSWAFSSHNHKTSQQQKGWNVTMETFTGFLRPAFIFAIIWTIMSIPHCHPQVLIENTIHPFQGPSVSLKPSFSSGIPGGSASPNGKKTNNPENQQRVIIKSSAFYSYVYVKTCVYIYICMYEYA